MVTTGRSKAPPHAVTRRRFGAATGRDRSGREGLWPKLLHLVESLTAVTLVLNHTAMPCEKSVKKPVRDSPPEQQACTRSLGRNPRRNGDQILRMQKQQVSCGKLH